MIIKIKSLDRSWSIHDETYDVHDQKMANQNLRAKKYAQSEQALTTDANLIMIKRKEKGSLMFPALGNKIGCFLLNNLFEKENMLRRSKLKIVLGPQSKYEIHER